MRREHTFLLLCLVLLGGCASAVSLRPGAEKVVVTDKAPQGTPLKLLLGVHGKGCGLFAKRGNREGALANLRNKALAAGADHVVIKSELPPYSDGFCTHQAFTIEAMGYSTRRPPRASAPQHASAAQPAGASVTPAVVPSSTQPANESSP
jgi:hypothetical protein